MIDSAAFLIGSYGAMASGLSIGFAKLSPEIEGRIRHLFAGVAPLTAVLGVRLVEADSVTLYGPDLLAAAGLVIFGIAVSGLIGRFLPDYQPKNRQPSSR